ncbi:hypothetical protein [Labilibacter marinus]|uniref:hypothetical protein n=1 Tax=Labilibacter marinus TaxID=1477105 RepID=UPI00094F8DA9|nr:hypothetical protein [Labilibacter marinus]
MNLKTLNFKQLALVFIFTLGTPSYSQYKKYLAHTARVKTIETGIYGLDDKVGIYLAYAQLNKRKALLYFLMSYGDRTNNPNMKDEVMLQFNYGKNIYNLNKHLFINGYLGGFISAQRTIGTSIGPTINMEIEYFFTKKWALKTSGALLYYSPLPHNKNLQWRAYGGIKYILAKQLKNKNKKRHQFDSWCK